MGLFIIAFTAFAIGIVLILLLKNVSPPPPQEQIHFDNPDDKPLYLLDREAFKEKCLEFLGKFNLEYKHSVWANNQELEVDMLDETPVVGGKYLALCIFDPPHQQVDLFKVKGFIESIKGEGAARGIVITTGYFTNDAQKAPDEDPVELVNVVSFLSYLKKFDIY
ncbi:MAG: restriction endonuclease [Nitrospinota bacterium]|nr:restriction endonuclease [Nitrospinota bacterium]MDH5789806.1 restriction endonuclease [Nitrospinota bacterium]